MGQTTVLIVKGNKCERIPLYKYVMQCKLEWGGLHCMSQILIIHMLCKCQHVLNTYLRLPTSFFTKDECAGCKSASSVSPHRKRVPRASPHAAPNTAPSDTRLAHSASCVPPRLAVPGRCTHHSRFVPSNSAHAVLYATRAACSCSSTEAPARFAAVFVFW